jgi:polyribonucleotide nucleotidyltransferase
MSQPPKKRQTSIVVGDAKITLETGEMARQANGAVVLHVGETTIFAAVSSKDTSNDQIDFFPLKVDYQEKFSSAGKTLGGFIKREGRPSERETLASRLIDRPIRPMFPEGYYNEVQVLTYVFSYDAEHPLEPLAICAASAALVISDIPLVKPIGAVSVAYVDGKFIINPSREKQKLSQLELVLAGTDEAILMIEGNCKFLTEEQVLEAIKLGHEAIKTICRALSAWQQEVGKEKELGVLRVVPAELKKAMAEKTEARLREALFIQHKKGREQALAEIKKEVMATFCPEGKEPLYSPFLIKNALEAVSSEVMRGEILDKKRRPDLRDLKTIRPITISQHLLPRAHGSSLFTRGETQALAVATLGGETMGQRYEDLHGEGTHRFYLQYAFPPFSVGEVGRIGAPGRREVGHGKLAERSLMHTLPPKEKFPYTIRVESNIMESNGSSSMASVCGGCLALMDAGVPIERPVAGIAMGLILAGDRYAILSDILGLEDALGDMDFKVAGDERGITAFQMDIKIEGITLEIMEAALHQAKEGRIHILHEMLKACPASKVEMSMYAPRIHTIQIKPSKIGAVIGPKGKQIQAIVEETGVEIDIDDSGLISIASTNKAGIERAIEIIKGITAEAEVGQVYEGKVTSVVAFGAFVEILPGKEGLCHISEFSKERIEKMEDVVKQGDIVKVKVIDINDRGQLKLSRKATLV